MAGLVERIREHSTPDKMNVALKDVAQELVDLTRAGNADGAKALFGAILDFELERANGKPLATVRRLTLENIDLASRIASQMYDGHRLGVAAAIVMQLEPTETGAVTSFFREAVGYSPKDFEN